MDPKSIKKPLKNHLKIEVRKKTVQNRKKNGGGGRKKVEKASVAHLRLMCTGPRGPPDN